MYKHLIATFILILTSVSEGQRSIDIPSNAQCASQHTKVTICLSRIVSASGSTAAANGCVNCANQFLNDLNENKDEKPCGELQDEACKAVQDCNCGACADEMKDFLDCSSVDIADCSILCSDAGVTTAVIVFVSVALAVFSGF